MKKVILYGLQRSGTNYLETLILKNFKVTFVNEIKNRISKKHKHLRFYSKQLNSYCSSEININLYFHDKETNDFSFLNEHIDNYFFIYKEPIHWLTSFEKFLLNCPGINKNNIDKKFPFEKRVLDYNLYIQHMNKIHEKYPKQMRVVCYEDLIQNTKQFLNELIDLGYERKQSTFTTNFNRVTMSPYTFDQKKINFIKNKEYVNLLTKEQLIYVKENIS